MTLSEAKSLLLRFCASDDEEISKHKVRFVMSIQQLANFVNAGFESDLGIVNKSPDR